MRVVLLRCLSLVAVALAAGAGSGAAAARGGSAQSHGIYVVRPDPRSCPSPRCGGYWVAFANHARTRCDDGLLRPRCYVASAEVLSTHQATSVPGNALARAVLGSTQSPDWGQLGVLFVSNTWSPVTGDQPTGAYYRLRAADCPPSLFCRTYVTRLNSRARGALVSNPVLPAGSSRSTLRHALIAMLSRPGLLASGRIAVVASGARVFVATQLYFRR